MDVVDMIIVGFMPDVDIMMDGFTDDVDITIEGSMAADGIDICAKPLLTRRRAGVMIVLRNMVNDRDDYIANFRFEREKVTPVILKDSCIKLWLGSKKRQDGQLNSFEMLLAPFSTIYIIVPLGPV